MSYVISDTDIGLILGAISTTLLIISRSPNLMKLIDGCAKQIMCIPTMLKIVHLKLRQPVEIVQEIDKQDNSKVKSKLGLSNGLVDELGEIAPGEDETIDEEVALAWIRAINLMKKNQNKKLKPLEMRKL